jgi:hypothetical protein
VQAENDRSAAEKARSDAKMALAESDILRKRLENWETSGLIEELNDPKFSQSDRDKLAPGRFEVLTYYVLWKTQGEERFDRLRRLLEKNANLIPDSYLIAPETEPRTTPDWPLVVEYSPDGLKPTGFNAMWGSIRDDAFKKFGIPLPVLARLSADDHLSRGQLRITNPDKREVLLTAPADGQYMIKWPPDPLNPGPARDFVQRFNTAWVEFKPNVQEYRLVPRWSLPFWKLADQTPTPPGGIAAYLAVLKLLKRPDLVFSKVAVNALLDQAAKTFPQTVAEARAARGDEIGPELAKRLQKYPKALAWLPSILDELSIPEQPPTTNTASTAAPARNSKDAIPSKDAVPWEQSLNGAWPAQSAKNIDAASKSTSLTTAGPEPYGDLGDRLGDFEPIRVNVATNLLPEWFPNDKLSQKLSEKLEDLRADVYARYGVNTPGFRFHPPNEGQTMAPNTIQVHVFEADSDPLLIGGPNKLQSLLSKLSSTLIDTREKWVTAETTDAALKRMPQNTRDWLQKRYSLTDLKRLLRHAVRSSSKDGGSVRYPTWMMNSLVFWVLADNPLDRNVLGDRLFSEQRVRLGKLQVPPADEMARIDSGVDALLDDDPTFATQVFQETLKIDRQRAIDAFNVFWARRSAAVWLRELRNEFGNLDAVAFDRPSQLDLEEQSKAADQTGDRASAWALTLYRFAAARSASSAEQKAAQRKPPSEPSDLQQVRRDLLSKVPDLQQVRPEEARWLAQRFLEQFSPLNAADAPLLETATRMLLRAVDGSVDGPTSLKIFTDMLDVAQKTPTPNWAWMLLDRLATVRPGDAKDSLALELAWNLCRQERIEPLIRALALADSYEEKVTTLATTMSQEDRETASVNIKDVRANVYLGLRQLGDNGRPSPEPLLRELARSAREDLRREVNLQLIQFLDQNDRHAEAVGVGQEAAKEWPDDVGFLGLIGSLQYGDRPDVMALAQSVSKKVNGNGPEHTDKGWLLTASLAGLMAHTSDWRQIAIRFLATQHDYVDYVRMIARAMDSGSDSSDWKKVLDERWKSINPASWRDRIRNGDVTAWREMLIGRFVEAKESENLLTTLDDPAAWAKSDFVNLPTSLKAQRCEAWFYEAMRAKAKGRKDAELDALRRSAATGYSSYFEYAMARFLLANGG